MKQALADYKRTCLNYGISNKGDLPTDTTYTWLTTPDVSQPGTTLGIVVVTYPDGSSEQIPVNVIVNANPTDDEKYAPVGQNVSTTVGKIPDAEKGISNKDDLPSGARLYLVNNT